MTNVLKIYAAITLRIPQQLSKATGIVNTTDKVKEGWEKQSYFN